MIQPIGLTSAFHRSCMLVPCVWFRMSSPTRIFLGATVWCSVLVLFSLFVYSSFDDLRWNAVLRRGAHSRLRTADLPNFDVIWIEYTNQPQPLEYNCHKFRAGDKTAIEKYNNAGRVTLVKAPDLNMACDRVRLRIMGNTVFPKQKHRFSVARNVYKDYHIQELLLAFSFYPENYYCYAIDSKTSENFVEKMVQLSNCLPNVIVLKKRYNFDSGGHFQDIAHLDCVEELMDFPAWEYALFLQNDDVLIKSSGEISDVIESLEGAPLITFEKPMSKRVPKPIDWTASALHLFNSGLNLTAEQAKANLTLVKSANQVLLPRTFLTDVKKYLNLTTLTKVCNDDKLFGIDEMLVASLVKSHQLGLAGQVQNQCKNEKDYLRFVDWNFYDRAKGCRSGVKRHSVCLLGVEYLHKLESIPQIVANKIWPELDFGIIMCVGEIIYSRMQNPSSSNLDLNVFKKLPQVREYSQKARGTFKASSFKC